MTISCISHTHGHVVAYISIAFHAYPTIHCYFDLLDKWPYRLVLALLSDWSHYYLSMVLVMGPSLTCLYWVLPVNTLILAFPCLNSWCLFYGYWLLSHFSSSSYPYWTLFYTSPRFTLVTSPHGLFQPTCWD